MSVVIPVTYPIFTYHLASFTVTGTNIIVSDVLWANLFFGLELIGD